MQARIWSEILHTLPEPHFLQTHEWAQVKAMFGWEPYFLLWAEQGFFSLRGLTQEQMPSLAPDSIRAACLVLKRPARLGRLAVPLCILYAPKGPLLDWTNPALCARVLDDLQTFARQQQAVFVKVDPDVILGNGIPPAEGAQVNEGAASIVTALSQRSWRESSDQIQFRNTVWIDLTPSEAELLARLKQKTRYNLRLAEKRGVAVHTGTKNDLPLLFKMYLQTSLRDGFAIRPEAYYRFVWETFLQEAYAGAPRCEPLIAEVDGQPVAALVLFYYAQRAYYVYGMSTEVHRDRMPNYLLQWEAMKRSRNRGCTIYDLWGAPDEFKEADPMWGVYRFKEGLGGVVVRTLGAWDFTPHQLLYRLYSEAVPAALGLMRWRGRREALATIGGA